MVAYIKGRRVVLIEGYNWKEKVIIALETENDIHFKIIFFWLKRHSF